MQNPFTMPSQAPVPGLGETTSIGLHPPPASHANALATGSGGGGLPPPSGAGAYMAATTDGRFHHPLGQQHVGMQQQQHYQHWQPRYESVPGWQSAPQHAAQQSAHQSAVAQQQWQQWQQQQARTQSFGAPHSGYHPGGVLATHFAEPLALHKHTTMMMYINSMWRATHAHRTCCVFC